jgi:hypothetical protein
MSSDVKRLGTGLIFAEFEIGADIESDFGPWHSGEHVAERLAIPGVLSARRYVSVSNSRQFCACYRATNSDVFLAPAYKSLAYKESALTLRMSENVVGTRFIGEVMRERGAGYGGLLCRVRVAPADDADLLAWFDASAERLLATRGIVRLTLTAPRRELEGLSDQNSILLVEGYDEEACSRIYRGELGLDGLGDVSCKLFRLAHIFP